MKEKRAWRHEDISLLKVTANIFYLALYRQEIEQENRRLLTNIISTQEKERRYLAQELHDEMGQLLTAMHMDASYLQTFESIKQDKDAFERVVAIDKLSTKVISRLRITTRRIRTATLDQLGLVAAIKELLTDWKTYNHSIIVTLSLVDQIDKVSEDVMLTFYRALQEGLTNISKYAKANNVYICLDELNDNGRKLLRLILSDDGIGIITKHKRQEGSGLLGMKERVRAVEGTINIAPNKNNRGIRIEIKVPLG